MCPEQAVFEGEFGDRRLEAGDLRRTRGVGGVAQILPGLKDDRHADSIPDAARCVRRNSADLAEGYSIRVNSYK